MYKETPSPLFWDFFIILVNLGCNSRYFWIYLLTLDPMANAEGTALSIADRKMLRKARNPLNRVSKDGKSYINTKQAKYLADALDEALRKK